MERRVAMTMEQKIAVLYDAIREVVSESGMTWQEKKNKILEEGLEEDKTSLYEFVAWFE